VSDAVVKIRGLRKQYGATVAVAEMDLEVPQGALFGLLGPNGAGKSTTFGILCGWLKPTAGSATVLSTPCHRLHLIAGKVGAMPQDAAFPRQVAVRSELIHFARLAGLGGPAALREADRVLDAVAMRDAGSSRGSELSHGMLKRVALAQALIGRPEVVFLDEPTAGLDPTAGRQVKDLVKALTPRATVIVSSHNLSEIQEICTHGAILDRGRIVSAGSIDQLTRKGAELTIEVRDMSGIVKSALEAAVPGAGIRVEANAVHVTFDASADVADIIARLLEVLLKARVPILGVRRGTSLETAFLEATSRPPP
jgi:ABC-2 type transport system ATP-binding protein